MKKEVQQAPILYSIKNLKKNEGKRVRNHNSISPSPDETKFATKLSEGGPGSLHSPKNLFG